MLTVLASVTLALAASGAPTPTPTPLPEPVPVSVVQLCAATDIDAVDALLASVADTELVGALAPLASLTVPRGEGVEIDASVQLERVRSALNCAPAPTTVVTPPPTTTTVVPTEDPEPTENPGPVDLNPCEINISPPGPVFVDALETLGVADAQAQVNQLGDNGIILIDADPDTDTVDIDPDIQGFIVTAVDRFIAESCADDSPTPTPAPGGDGGGDGPDVGGDGSGGVSVIPDGAPQTGGTPPPPSALVLGLTVLGGALASATAALDRRSRRA